MKIYYSAWHLKAFAQTFEHSIYTKSNDGQIKSDQYRRGQTTMDLNDWQ